MKRIRVALTNQGRVITITCPSDLPSLLQRDESIIHNWFYDRPYELESFFKQHPEEEPLFAKGFAYWIICRVFNIQENQNNYGLLKRELKNFSSKLFRSIRSLAGKVADQIILFRKRLEGDFSTRYTNKKYFRWYAF